MARAASTFKRLDSTEVATVDESTRERASRTSGMVWSASDRNSMSVAQQKRGDIRTGQDVADNLLKESPPTLSVLVVVVIVVVVATLLLVHDGVERMLDRLVLLFQLAR